MYDSTRLFNAAVDLVWTAAVRVSFAISPASRVMDCHPIKEKEARVNIPIQTEQFQQVCSGFFTLATVIN